MSLADPDPRFRIHFRHLLSMSISKSGGTRLESYVTHAPPQIKAFGGEQHCPHRTYLLASLNYHVRVKRHSGEEAMLDLIWEIWDMWKTH